MSLIYLDNQATTPLDPRVWDVMVPFFQGGFGNAGSIDTARGRDADGVVQNARAQIATAIGAQEKEIVLTSGATEANNLAIIGAMRLQIAKGRPRVLTFSTEHKCVLEAAKSLEGEGALVEILPVQSDGLIELAHLEQAMDDRVGLISAMAVNNEIGVIQNLVSIGQLAEHYGALFHCDMAQALGKIPVDLSAMPIALASFSAHKAYGPMGVGALFVRHRPRARIAPLFHGGGQERGLRSGTLPLPLIAGFGHAAELATRLLSKDLERQWAFREQVLSLIDRQPNLHLNGHRDQRIPGNLNLRISGLDQAAVRAGLTKFEFSRGSACTAEDLEPSYVLTALGLNREQAHGSFRLSFGRYTIASEIDALVQDLETLCSSVS